jgi:hypothetical protein
VISETTDSSFTPASSSTFWRLDLTDTLFDPFSCAADVCLVSMPLFHSNALMAGLSPAFLAAQNDLGTKWAPRFVRVCPELPVTATSKVLVRTLRAERWNGADPVWWQPGRALDTPYRRLDRSDAAGLEEAAGRRGAVIC